MSARRINSAAGLVAAALALCAPAAAQVSSAPLAQVDPWSVGWLGRNEALPNSIWTNTTSDALAPLFSSIEPQALSPAGRATLRRILMSSAKGPPEGASLIPERLRLLEQLGETERSIDLRKRFPDSEWGKLHEVLASEYELVHGRQQAACARVAEHRADDPDWMPVRAFCLALAKDFNGATLVGEHLTRSQESGDPWLIAAISAMDPAVKTRPDGRYGAPFEAAVSIAARLSVPANAFAATPADIAAAIVRHPTATLEQKRAALAPSLAGGRIEPDEVLEVLSAKDETPAARSGQRSAQRTNFLQLALAAASSAEADAAAKSAAFAAALKGADTAGDFHLAAAALSEAVRSLSQEEAAAANAETFARAALILGDAKQAGEWRRRMDEKADPWAAARLDLMLACAAGEDEAGPILDRLIAALPPAQPSSGRASANAGARQIDLRRIENTRALFLMVGTGRDLSPEHRALLASQRTAGRGVSDAAIASIIAALDQDAKGEAALAVVSLLGPDTSALSFAGLADLLSQLRRAGLEKEADALALESLQVWKAL